MLPLYRGKWKRLFDSLCKEYGSAEASHMVDIRMEAENHRKQMKQLEDENRALRQTIRQLVLYGTK